MRYSYKKITIIQLDTEPPVANIDQELQFLGTSLGLFGMRDKDRSLYRIFIALVRALKSKQELTSDELAYQLELTRGTVVHHLNNLLSSGIVIEKNNRYKMRSEKLSELLKNMKSDVEKTYDELISVAEHIDEKLGL